tara:strand:- start:2406 stop:2828 length:423 start_codon:yes stop_codon:yes gene_type:complete
MHKYRRYQVDKGFSDLFGEQVRVIGDADWVTQAIRESWFSISKNRGTWWVYLPYTLVFDVPGHDETESSVQHFYQTAREVFSIMNVRSQQRHDSDGYMDHFRARFQSRKQAEQFAFIMQLQGCRYIPHNQVRQGPCENPE